MKVFKICIISSLLAMIISIFAFWRHIDINIASICPVFLIFLSLLQIVTFISSAKSAENGESETAYSPQNDLSTKEYALLFRTHAIVKILLLPILVLLSIFFSSVVKVIFSIAFYIVSFALAKLVFKYIKRKDRNENC